MIHLFLVGLILSIFLVGVLYQEESLLKVVTLGTTGFFFSYVLASAILFSLDVYSVWRALLAVVIVLGFLSMCILIKKKERPIFTFELKEWGMLLLILLLVLPATLGKFEFFGMGQDQGVYQTKAIELINGNNQRIFDFDEINILEDENKKEDYYNTVKSLLGYDLLNYEKPTLENVEGASEVAGIYHGIPTWASILALFGQLFGISNMQQCQTVFLILFLLIVFYTLENLKIKPIIQMPALLILGFSPQILWVSKSALTEMFLAVIVACFVLLLLERKKNMRTLSFVPILVFSFFHVTIYTMMPFVVLVYWGMYLIGKEKRYVTACNVSLVGYFVGFLFMVYISPDYTMKNYVTPLSSLKFINDDSIFWVVLVVMIVVLAITNIFPKFAETIKAINVSKWIYQRRDILLKIFICCLLGVFAFKCIHAGLELNGNITLVSYAISSGIFLLPGVIVLILFKKKSHLIGEGVYVIFLAFIYTIIIYSVFLNFDIQYQYYYGRYLVPYIFVIVVAFCYLINSIRRKHVWMLCFFGGLFFATPNQLLTTEPDDTRMSWEMLERTMTIVNEENVAIVVSHENSAIFFLPLKSAGASVFTEWDDLDSQMKFLSGYYDKVYYLTEQANEEDGYSLIYRNEHIISEYETHGQNISSYPLQVLSQGENIVSVYKYNAEPRLVYNVCDENFEGVGFSAIENNRFAWTGNKRASIFFYVNKQDYMVTVSQGGRGIPLKDLGLEEYVIDVYINKIYLTTLTINQNNNGQELVFGVSEEFLSNNKNVISFEYKSWSPSDYGSADTRKMGFSFSEIEFQPVDED